MKYLIISPIGMIQPGQTNICADFELGARLRRRPEDRRRPEPESPSLDDDELEEELVSELDELSPWTLVERFDIEPFSVFSAK